MRVRTIALILFSTVLALFSTAIYVKIPREVHVRGGIIDPNDVSKIRVYMSDDDRMKIARKSVNVYQVPCGPSGYPGIDVGFMSAPYPADHRSEAHILFHIRDFEEWMKPKISSINAREKILSGLSCAYIQSAKDYGFEIFRSNRFKIVRPGTNS